MTCSSSMKLLSKGPKYQNMRRRKLSFVPHRFRMRARISGHAVSRTCNLAASQNHTLTVSHFLFIFEEPISIIVEPSEKPGCEEIERSKYRDSGRSGKAPSEARDRGTRYRHEARNAYSSKMQYHSPAISKHHKVITSQFHIPKVQSFREP